VARPDSRPGLEGQRAPGRVHVVQHSTAHQTQVLLMTDAEAADWIAATVAGEN
jgi:hypothetical protein